MPNVWSPRLIWLYTALLQIWVPLGATAVLLSLISPYVPSQSLLCPHPLWLSDHCAVLLSLKAFVWRVFCFLCCRAGLLLWWLLSPPPPNSLIEVCSQLSDQTGERGAPLLHNYCHQCHCSMRVQNVLKPGLRSNIIRDPTNSVDVPANVLSPNK